MWRSTQYLFRNSTGAKVLVLLFVLLAFWWTFLPPFSPTDQNEFHRFVWGACYQLVAIVGAVLGITSSRSWGGWKSVIGRTLLAFSLGLLFQSFGQTVYSYYNLVAQVEAPYPSLGDIGFFGSIPLYIYGVVLLAKAAGAKVSLRAFVNQIQAVIIPLVILLGSYFEFLKGYEFDWTEPLRTLLDFGYPFGQAIYVSIALLTYLLSRKILGGLMRGPVLSLVFALVVQYVADFNFLFQFSRETWYVGGYGDLLYMVAYLLMGMSLLQVGVSYKRVMETA
jgi:hypothetical protein